ncbi:hypothetical protein [Streptomyces sp. G-G2]|uniref:hypothetical protein n=1 Tax=Streptomyces sp. G-G2 TaxID=3046201 RepID=UPI0024BBAF61|nr:hypothetical protein [Streptomyces sp. G-G2]MDJ0386285.1 hypothetical protein [Streptomyces sp. G-G2]
MSATAVLERFAWRLSPLLESDEGELGERQVFGAEGRSALDAAGVPVISAGSTIAAAVSGDTEF